jgi:hypothetical protein
MVTQLVEFPLGDGGSIVVASNAPETDASPGPVFRGGGRTEAVVTRASESFESVVQRAQPAAVAVLDAVRSGPNPPTEVRVEFGLQLSADLGAVIASTAVQANFTVTLTWRRDAD